jgi:chemotaxis-related protein WspD
VSDPHALPVVDCWNRIGVRGDRSCPELPGVIHCHNCHVFTAAAQTLLDRPAARDYLSELTEFVSEPIAQRKLADRSAVLVRIGSEHFAIATGSVQEVAEVAPPRSVPHRGNRVFEGLVNVRGQLELCVSVAGMLGIPRGKEDQAPMRCALIVTHAGQRWVLLIDSVLGVQRFHDSQLIEPPAASRRTDTPHVTALVAHEGQHFGWLDVARLCGDLAESVRGGSAVRGETP